MDKYADIRAALDAATPGPWFTHRSLGFAVATVGIHRIASDSEPVADPTSDIRYIAAANPEAIRALLAERDALRDALDLVADLSSQEWQDQNGKRMAATGNDGKRFWFITDDVMQAARAALAQGEA